MSQDLGAVVRTGRNFEGVVSERCDRLLGAPEDMRGVGTTRPDPVKAEQYVIWRFST